MEDIMLKVVELFSGVGSQRMALNRLDINFEVVGISEIDKYALQSYKAIHGDCPNLGDITKINPEDVPEHNLLTYSFPCQDISIVGKMQGLKKGGDTRSGLLWEVSKIIKQHRPKYLLLENVKNLVGEKFKPDFDKWLQWLDKQGYVNYYEVLNAKDYGIPQNRERVFVVSIRKDVNAKRVPYEIGFFDNLSYRFPETMELKFTIQDIADFGKEVPRRIVNSMYKKTGDFGNRFNTQSKISPCVIAKSGYAAITNNYYTKDFKEYTIDEIYKKNIPVYANSDKMAWLLMGFSDDDFQKAQDSGVSEAQLYKQAGNSIVVDVLVGIFKELLCESHEDTI
jgi:DNA (cytosine-5)-methyltransferase 1